MTTSALTTDRPSVRIGGTTYPLLLPTLRDPRLHLAAVIVTLQVLGQTVFDFRLSIAQILVSLVTCAVLEVGIAMRRQHVLMWPASALLTGNGVAFVLRVPGTEHGDWWSMHGWWIFAGTAAVSLLSKYVITFRGRHVFNPSNFGLVLCFLLLGPERADPLPFWWGPMSVWLALALVLIVGGGLAILSRLRLVGIAVGFWLTFAAGVAVLAASGHELNAPWHLGPITGWDLWWLLVTSPEILVFLFFMITDPRTIPETARGRHVYAVSVGFVAALLIAPWTSEFAAKVAVLAALAIVCAARPLIVGLGVSRRLETAFEQTRARPRGVVAGAAFTTAGVAALALVAAGLPSRPGTAVAAPVATDRVPQVTVARSEGLAAIDRAAARRVAAALVAGLSGGADALRTRDRARARDAATGAWLAELWARIDAARGRTIDVPTYEARSVVLRLEAGEGQGPPVVLATLTGTTQVATYGPSVATPVRRTPSEPVVRTFELSPTGGRYLVADVRGSEGAGAAPLVRAPFRLTDVAASVGLDFRHAAFSQGMSTDVTAMMGGGVCWLDYDGDGWLDLYAVNGYAATDASAPRGVLQSRLYRNVRGRFVDVTRASGAGLTTAGSGCVAADLDGNGAVDLVVTAARYDPERNAYDALLWNDGDGTFTEGAKAAGIDEPGWHTGAAVADVNGDGRLDLFVAGYTDVNAAIPGSGAGFPADHRGVRDLLYVNEGGRPQPRFREVGRAERVDDPNAGMGIAVGDYSGDRLEDLFVTNSRGQLHAVYRGRSGEPYADARPDFVGALGQQFTGWGASWADLDLDGRPELAIANGKIPVTSIPRDAEPLQVVSAPPVHPLDTGASEPRNGRGLAAADYDNDGDPDLAVSSIGGRLQLFRNDGARGHWLEVEGLPPAAAVTATLPDGRRLVREAHAGSSYLSSEDPRAHFGLGDATTVAELVVRLPDGAVARLHDVPADRLVAVRP